jgi:hypothetical protein
VISRVLGIDRFHALDRVEQTLTDVDFFNLCRLMSAKLCVHGVQELLGAVNDRLQVFEQRRLFKLGRTFALFTLPAQKENLK